MSVWEGTGSNFWPCWLKVNGRGDMASRVMRVIIRLREFEWKGEGWLKRYCDEKFEG
jgi:hypothetical protein